ncbi:hypothetical protein [Candidatus Tokpelaia sp.]|uniref:hypothetical protein n=1 Tax=Candidatus Tokpelaia sp. TaxID=2233777 RepID=UPI001238F66C|nr:hypothetical protein [Candidatus Tokpelaia sp.]KAA6405664.1 hypothetical protein DPQ22_03100 [Candidatus Tokpelaia sp.]
MARKRNKAPATDPISNNEILETEQVDDNEAPPAEPVGDWAMPQTIEAVKTGNPAYVAKNTIRFGGRYYEPGAALPAELSDNADLLQALLAQDAVAPVPPQE